MRARGMGANVVVTEIKPTAALKAVLDGFRVMEMDEAAKVGDISITATGMKDIIVGEHPARRPRVYPLAQGRLVNLAAAEGHPSEAVERALRRDGALRVLSCCAWAPRA